MKKWQAEFKKNPERLTAELEAARQKFQRQLEKQEQRERERKQKKEKEVFDAWKRISELKEDVDRGVANWSEKEEYKKLWRNYVLYPRQEKEFNEWYLPILLKRMEERERKRREERQQWETQAEITNETSEKEEKFLTNQEQNTNTNQPETNTNNQESKPEKTESEAKTKSQNKALANKAKVQKNKI